MFVKTDSLRFQDDNSGSYHYFDKILTYYLDNILKIFKCNSSQFGWELAILSCSALE